MRVGLVIGVGAALLAAAPASAQFAAPFGGIPGALTVPEAATGAMSAGAAHSLQQQQCQTTYAGREGPRTVCTPAPAPAPRR